MQATGVTCTEGFYDSRSKFYLSALNGSANAMFTNNIEY